MEQSKEKRTQTAGTYVPDSPVTDPKQDRFRRWPFAQGIAQTIASRRDPTCIVIGIYGAWGEGKTTVLNFIQCELEESQDVICVKFNPWRFGDEGVLLKSFFKTVADALHKSLSTKTEKVGRWLEQYSSIVAPVSFALGASVGIKPGETIKGLGKAVSSVGLETLKERIEKFLAEEKRRVVVLMDDVDRLDKTEINNVFKLIKLTADFDHTAYVLAFDNEMVAAALREKYASGSSDPGESFLEKIIQVPLRLPKADRISLRKLCLEGVDEAVHAAQIAPEEEEVQRFVRYFIDGFERRLQTPRMAKRYGNALTFALPILRGEVNVTDLMLLEALRLFYPRLYGVVRENRELFLGSSSDYLARNEYVEKKKEKIFGLALEGLSPEEGKRAKSVLEELFPRTGRSRYGADWEERWAKQKRICSKFYFDRYFSYTIPEGDVPDAVLEEFIGKLQQMEIREVVKFVQNTVSPRNADLFVSKLRDREEGLGSEDSKKLGIAVSLSGLLFPNPETLYSHTTAFSQAAILVAQLAKKIPRGIDRVSYGEKVMLEAEPLSFAIESWRWMRSAEEEEDPDRTFSKEEENQLSRRLAERIKDCAQSEVIYLKYPKDSQAMFAIWADWVSKEETSKYLAEYFAANQSNVIQFLKTYLPTAWVVESGLPHKDHFQRRQYDSLERVVDPEIVFTSLREIYGEELDRATWDESRFESLDKRVAFQFASIHLSVKKERQKQLEEGRTVSPESGRDSS
ncbi:MAG: KAP family NTPase [Bacteroidota bacterium]